MEPSPTAILILPLHNPLILYLLQTTHHATITTTIKTAHGTAKWNALETTFTTTLETGMADAILLPPSLPLSLPPSLSPSIPYNIHLSQRLMYMHHFYVPSQYSQSINQALSHLHNHHENLHDNLAADHLVNLRCSHRDSLLNSHHLNPQDVQLPNLHVDPAKHLPGSQPPIPHGTDPPTLLFVITILLDSKLPEC